MGGYRLFCQNLLVLAVLLVSSQAAPAVVDLQAEESVDVVARMRGEAEGQRTAWLAPDQPLTVTFCLPADDNVTVSEVRFSSDGMPMGVAVMVDTVQVGSFQTTNTSDNGFSWNRFNVTTDYFESVTLTQGQHEVQIVVKNYTDTWGIEIDRLTVHFSNNLTADMLLCPEAETAEEKDSSNSTSTEASEPSDYNEAQEDEPKTSEGEEKSPEGDSETSEDGATTSDGESKKSEDESKSPEGDSETSEEELTTSEDESKKSEGELNDDKTESETSVEDTENEED